MTQQEMNLFQLTASRMTEPGARSSEVVRCEFRHLQFLGVQLDYVPNHFLCYSIAPNGSCATNAAKQLPEVIRAAVNHSSRNCFTQSGTGTVRTCPPFPMRSTIAQRSSRR